MVKKNILLSIQSMEEIAKRATYVALVGYSRPVEDFEKLVLGTVVTDSQGIFELYIPGETPRDAMVISSAVVDRISGEVKVEIFLNKKVRKRIHVP